MFLMTLDPPGLAALLSSMTVLATHRIPPLSVTFGRHPRLGTCAVVQAHSSLDAVVHCERSPRSFLAAGPAAVT